MFLHEPASSHQSVYVLVLNYTLIISPSDLAAPIANWCNFADQRGWWLSCGCLTLEILVRFMGGVQNMLL